MLISLQFKTNINKIIFEALPKEYKLVFWHETEHFDHFIKYIANYLSDGKPDLFKPFIHNLLVFTYNFI